MKQVTIIFLMFLMPFAITAQLKTDSLKVTAALEEIFTVCNSSSHDEGSDKQQIIFDRLAPYILCFSEDVHRNKKAAADYNKPSERKYVNQFGESIKRWLDDYDNYKINNHLTQTKANGENWHALEVEFSKNKKRKKAIFGFMKLGDSFLLGDID